MCKLASTYFSYNVLLLQLSDCGYFDIVFIVDHSESIVPLTEDEEDNYLDTVKSYMTNITSHFNIDPYFGTQVAAVSFSDSARIEFSLREATSNAKVRHSIKSEL